MSEVNGSGRNREQSRVRDVAVRWAGRIVVRVCATVVIGLLAPHVPGVEPPHGNFHPDVCVVDDRT
jgi:hypothetical protein